MEHAEVLSGLRSMVPTAGQEHRSMDIPSVLAMFDSWHQSKVQLSALSPADRQPVPQEPQEGVEVVEQSAAYTQLEGGPSQLADMALPAGSAPTATSVEYTVPRGLCFVYQGGQLCFVDNSQDCPVVLRQGEYPPTTGLRAQFIRGTQSSRDTAAVLRAVPRPCSSSSILDAAAAGQLMCQTGLEDMPDPILHLIGQQLLHGDASPDSECEAVAAACVMACTGSRASLIIAHSVWEQLDPEIMPVQGLQHAPGSAMPPQQEVSAIQDQPLVLAALRALADPLHCTLSAKVWRLRQLRHREFVANKLLRRHNRTVDTLPHVFGIRQSMKEWIDTGSLDGVIVQSSNTAVTTISERNLRLEELQAIGRAAHRVRFCERCRRYVLHGIGKPDAIINALILERRLACMQIRQCNLAAKRHR